MVVEVKSTSEAYSEIKLKMAQEGVRQTNEQARYLHFLDRAEAFLDYYKEFSARAKIDPNPEYIRDFARQFCRVLKQNKFLDSFPQSEWDSLNKRSNKISTKLNELIDWNY